MNRPILLNYKFFNGNGKSFPEKNVKSLPEKSEAQHSTTTVVLDTKLFAVLILAGTFIFLNKIFVNSMPFAEDGLLQISKYAQKSIEDAWQWAIYDEKNKSYILPILLGAGFTVFSWIFVYLDSLSPGVYPPSPFSPASKYKYRQQKTSSMHLGYTTAVLSGIVVSGLILYDL